MDSSPVLAQFVEAGVECVFNVFEFFFAKTVVFATLDGPFDAIEQVNRFVACR
jgi:hypothetical protein